MNRRVLGGALMIGAAAAIFMLLRAPAPESGSARASRPVTSGLTAAAPRAPNERTVELERRVDALAAKLAAETAERRRLQDRLDAMAAQLAAAGTDAEPAEVAAAPADTAPDGAADAGAATTAEPPAGDDRSTRIERALVSAGVDPATAADVKRRQDELVLADIYLRDQATREGWLDSPRFHDELAALQNQRVSVRDEIGDERYDRYLAALGEPNRVRVDEVLTASPAAAVGMQAGDVVLRYGDARIFAPDDLVAETRSGTAGETVRVEVLRGGQRLDLEVPRGPLGLRIAASQANPDEG